MKQPKKKLILPKFPSEDAERKFWDRFDLSKYAGPEDLEEVYFPNLKPTSEAISLRMPKFMLLEIKQKANTLSVPYQALIKQYVAEGLKKQ